MFPFNFDLWDRNGECHSRRNMKCSYYDGSFDFDGLQIPVGNSLENNNGGAGGFVGPNHEYFVYCGSKYAEIAIAKLNEDTNEWENCGGVQWSDLEDDEDGFFQNIWFTQKGLALIFEPRKKYRSALMQRKGPPGTKICIKLNLSTGVLTGLTGKQFLEQRHSIVNENSEWPHPEDCPFYDSSSESTLIESPRPISTQQALISDIVDDTKAELCACLDEAFRKLTIILDVGTD